jgi:hypothetical protein
MTSADLTARTASMTASTTSFSSNPVVDAFARLRSTQPERTPAQRAAFAAEHQRVTDLLASPAFRR